MNVNCYRDNSWFSNGIALNKIKVITSSFSFIVLLITASYSTCWLQNEPFGIYELKMKHFLSSICTMVHHQATKASPVSLTICKEQKHVKNSEQVHIYRGVMKVM